MNVSTNGADTLPAGASIWTCSPTRSYVDGVPCVICDCVEIVTVPAVGATIDVCNGDWGVAPWPPGSVVTVPPPLTAWVVLPSTTVYVAEAVAVLPALSVAPTENVCTPGEASRLWSGAHDATPEIPPEHVYEGVGVAPYV